MTRYGVALGAAALAACLAGCAGAARQPATSRPGTPAPVEVTALRDVLVSAWPLGDVMTGGIHAGESATAICFVAGAQTNAGVTGSAIKVRHGHLVGYAAVTTLPADGSKRTTMFDADEGTLKRELPPCPGNRPGG